MSSSLSNEDFHGIQRGVSNKAIHTSYAHLHDILSTSEETQAEVLSRISSWTTTPWQSNQILWVYGQTVPDRTFIAQTVIDTCRSSGRFGGSFFFQRGVQERDEGSYLFPTIASQLATNIPGLKTSVDNAVRDDSAPSSKSVSDQFHMLIARPLRNMTSSLPESYFIVIDGLDECADKDNAQQIILNCIADSVSLKLPLRFLITSGIRPNISQAFESDALHNATLRIALQPSEAFHYTTREKPFVSPPSKPRRIMKQPLQFSSYPRVVTLQHRNGHVESYCRSLLLAGHGFPIWRPSGNLGAPVEYLIKGVNIGDVGIIDNHGFFRFYFNIFLPPDNTINRGRTPREFRPIDPPLRPDEIIYEKEYFKPGHVVASKGVIMKRHSESPLDISFSSTEPDGGILILPAGASREDLASTDRFHEYARKNAPHWYQYINHYGITSHANGSLFLVTGCDKANDWAIASFPYHSGDTENTLHLRYTWEPDYGPPWIDPGTAETDFFSPLEELPSDCKENNQCIFLRGLQISLTQQSWQKTLPYVEEAKRHYTFILHTPSKFQVWLNSILVFLRVRLSEKRAIDTVSVRNPHLFHPNYVISQVLLAEYPDAELVLVDDTIWCSLVDNELCTMPEINELITKILHLNKIVENNGVISLQAKANVELDPPEDEPKTSKLFNRNLHAFLSTSQGAVLGKKKPNQWVKSVPVYKHARLF